MFVKPYRSHVTQLNGMTPKLWLERDLNMAPPKLVKSLTEHYSRFNIDLIPVLNSATSVSFRYVDSDDYIVRDLGYASVIMKSLLDLKITGGFNNRIDSIVNKISRIDKFIGVNNGGLFYQILSRQTYIRSIVVGLKSGADCISDIEYIELCYDNKPNVIPFLMPIQKKFPIRTKRTGVKLKLDDYNFENTAVYRTGVKIRLYLEPTPASYLVKKESVNCIEDINISYFDTVKPGKMSDYLLESTEHHLNIYYKDVDDDLVLAFMEVNKERLSQKFGYTVTHIDKDMINLIEMAIF